MKKLSNITESVWTDIQKRSSGDDIRKEDDINLLDKDGLYEYILSHYELTDNRYELTYGTANMCIPISIKGEEILLTYEFDEVHCYFKLNEYPKLYSLLQKKFNVEEMSDNDEKLSIGEHYIISPKDECTNQFYIDVIDCIIENRNTIVRKKELNESIWTDIQKRSSGDDIRKEDDINLLDETGLAKYMEKIYMSPNDDLHIIADKLNFGTIMISLFEINGKYYNIIYQKISTSNPEITFPVCPDSDIEDLLRELYKVTRLKQYNDKIYKIEPNDGNKITNKFFIEVLDFILKETEGKYTILLKKK